MRQGHSIETIRSMVASGYGISVLPKSALSDLYRSELVVPIPFTSPPPLRRVALAWRRSSVHQSVVQALVAAVRQMNKAAYLPVD
jgi:LysR family hydrogen peroxide-inducible transcriptional activator